MIYFEFLLNFLIVLLLQCSAFAMREKHILKYENTGLDKSN